MYVNDLKVQFSSPVCPIVPRERESVAHTYAGIKPAVRSGQAATACSPCGIWPMDSVIIPTPFASFVIDRGMLNEREAHPSNAIDGKLRFGRPSCAFNSEWLELFFAIQLCKTFDLSAQSQITTKVDS